MGLVVHHSILLPKPMNYQFLPIFFTNLFLFLLIFTYFTEHFSSVNRVTTFACKIFISQIFQWLLEFVIFTEAAIGGVLWKKIFLKMS